MVLSWTLILYLGGLSTTAVPGFTSAQACVEAGEAWVAQREHWWERSHGFTCVPVR